MAKDEEKESIDQPQEEIEESQDQLSTSSDESEEDEGTESTDQAEEQSEEDEQLYEVNGEKITLDEMMKGYMRQQDYTRKTAEVASMRRQIEQGRQAREEAGGESGYTKEEQEALNTLKKLGVATKSDMEMAVLSVMNRIKAESEYERVKNESKLDDDMMFVAQGLSIRKGIPLSEAVKLFTKQEKTVPHKSVSVKADVSGTVRKGENKEITPEYIKSLDTTTPAGKKEFERIRTMMENGEL